MAGISFSLLMVCVYVYVDVSARVKDKALKLLRKSLKKLFEQFLFKKFSMLLLSCLKKTSIQTSIRVKNNTKVKQKQSDVFNIVDNGLKTLPLRFSE